MALVSFGKKVFSLASASSKATSVIRQEGFSSGVESQTSETGALRIKSETGSIGFENNTEIQSKSYDPPGAVVTKPMLRYDFDTTESIVKERLRAGKYVLYTLNDYELSSVDDGFNGRINIFKLMADAKPLTRQQRDILGTRLRLRESFLELPNTYDARIYKKLAEQCSPLQLGSVINLQEIIQDAQIN